MGGTATVQAEIEIPTSPSNTSGSPLALDREGDSRDLRSQRAAVAV
jgi:hypothetical protein